MKTTNGTNCTNRCPSAIIRLIRGFPKRIERGGTRIERIDTDPPFSSASILSIRVPPRPIFPPSNT